LINKKSIIKSVFYAYLLLLVCLSLLIGGPDNEENIIHKLSITDSGFFLHVAAYFVASVLGVQAINEKQLTKIILILVLIFFYGFLLEIVQIFHPHRTFNIYDVLANGVGIVVYGIIYRVSFHKSFHNFQFP